jgi:alanyl-tRNA synthetase
MKLFSELRANYNLIQELAEVFGSDRELMKKVRDFQKRLSELEKLNQDNCMRLAQAEAEELLQRMEKAKRRVISQKFENYPNDTLRAIADLIRERAQDSVGIIYQEAQGKINYLLFVGPALVKKYPANKLMKDVSKILGGGGGGRPHLAEGGGGNPKKVADAVAYLEGLINK